MARVSGRRAEGNRTHDHDNDIGKSRVVCVVQELALLGRSMRRNPTHRSKSVFSCVAARTVVRMQAWVSAKKERAGCRVFDAVPGRALSEERGGPFTVRRKIVSADFMVSC